MINILYSFAAFLFRVFFKVFYRYEIYGLENIPKEGRLVIMANHVRYYDPPLIGCILKRKIHFLAKEELFKIPLLGYLLGKIGQIPVKRGKPDRSALKGALAILEEEKVLGIFPEGTTRGSKESLGKAKSGSILIPIEGKSPIVPVGIKYKTMKAKVSFGKVFYLDQYYDRKLSKEERQEAGTYIMNKIQAELDKL
ncbi:MAG TPA: 1-acyl-sn-glycerol-3-phosphate acyltransferase [Halanaerobiaceae bacterium]|nr:1-acyl-sn-glycerol-3-phosphate acyltransferase [Halanaerobiaceae bacterium]